MTDPTTQSGQPPDFALGQTRPSSSGANGQNQRRQDTTSSYTSMGTTPDFETLLNEQADGGNGNPISAGGIWGMGSFDTLQSPISGIGHSMFHQQSSAQQQFASDQKAPSASSLTQRPPSSGGTHSRRLSGTGSLPRDRRRSSENTEAVAGRSALTQGEITPQQVRHSQQRQHVEHIPSSSDIQQKQLYDLQTGAHQKDPRFLNQDRVMAYLQSQGLLSSRQEDLQGQLNAHSRNNSDQSEVLYGMAAGSGPLSEAQQAAMFRAMMGMQQQGPQQRIPTHMFTQDPGIWLPNATMEGAIDLQNTQLLHRRPSIGLSDLEYDYGLGPSSAPPMALGNDASRMGGQADFRFGDSHAQGFRVSQTAPHLDQANSYLELQQLQQIPGNQFTVYRSPHIYPSNISPGPSPLLAPQQLVPMSAEDMDLQARAIAQAQFQAQLQLHSEYNTPAFNRSVPQNLAVEAMVRRHSHQRDASAASSYAGSVQGLEGLEDQFLSVTGLGQLTDNPFEGQEASGLFETKFVNMDTSGENHQSVAASKGSILEEFDKTGEMSAQAEPVFGIWTTIEGNEQKISQGDLWQAQVDSTESAAASGSTANLSDQILFAEPSSMTNSVNDSTGSEGASARLPQTGLRRVTSLETSGASEFSRAMSTTRTPSSSSSVSVSNNSAPRDSSSVANHAPPTRSATLESMEGFPMPPFQTHSASSPGSGGSRSNSPVPPFNQPRRVKTLSGPQAKPHSPPQLFIPDGSSPSPSVKAVPLFPSRMLKSDSAGLGVRSDASTSYPYQPGQMTLGIPTGGNAGGHPGSGAFLSPIGPGGPSINIVPSTPTSGLREARGIWEKLAIQAQQNQRAQHEQPNASVQVSAGTIPAPQGPSRRASHAGIYVPVTSNNAAVPPAQATSQDCSDMADAAAQYGLINDIMTVPTLRQRTRSEGAISAMVSDHAVQDLQQQWLQQAHPDVSIDPRMLMGQSTMSSQSSTPGAGSAPVEMQGMVYMGANGVPVYVPRLGVVPGPEAIGANFIVTNDGRRLSFDSRLERASALMGAKTSDSSAMRMAGGSAGNIKQENFDELLTSMANPGERDSVRLSVAGQHRRQVKSEDWGRPAHMVDPSSQQWLIPEPQSSSRRSSLASNGSGSRSNSPSRPRASSPYSRPPINDSIPYPQQSPHVSPARSTYSLQDSGSDASGNSGRRGRGAKIVNDGGRASSNKIPRAKVTTPATEVASRGRRTSDGLFECPVPGCGSTFTRQFNLKGHIRSHNEERPYKCTFEGCDKSFARQHDCKRHMQLHIGIKPFVCENCNRTFARLDALSRHHKTESGAECALKHPLPTNPDGSLMSESKYRAEMERRKKAAQNGQGSTLPTVTEGRKLNLKMEE
ncbi:hypothetical protein NliqN6_5584 [Naganishia liquefaciens]|uniref:C2H2-type domain-containing protein n=1 Tax=Naganishia liquefaciens TaxID=104408 RepID=A0A8H3TXZ1_9TREE|nr:hypothetical protein NliqN6_5584 [Naganishia liquefaciens]